jgi:hypothetical protein
MAKEKPTADAAAQPKAAPPTTDFKKIDDGDNTIKGPHPGASIKKNDMTFEDLGDLMTFEEPKPDKEAEGRGEFMTVLSDYLSGADGMPHYKGEVVRLSKLVTNYAPDDATRASVLRLLNIDAIRKATRQEIAAGVANVTLESESPEVRKERQLRMAAEAELAQFKAQMQGGGQLVTDETTNPPVTPPVDPEADAESKAKDALDDDNAWK